MNFRGILFNPVYVSMLKKKTKQHPFTYPLDSNGRQYEKSKMAQTGTSSVVQQLRLHASNAGDLGLIPGWGTNTPPAAWYGQKKKKKKKKRHIDKKNDIFIPIFLN